jgi:polygalacturonase
MMTDFSSKHQPGSHRRDFLRAGGGAAAISLLPALRGAANDPWEEARGILARIKAPEFASRQFDVARFGAAGDGKTDCTAAIARAITECNAAGGGIVTFPAGVFFTGPIRLKSNVNLHVPANTTLKFTQDTSRYLPLVYSRWEGVELMNYSACIYADGEQNIALTGAGTIDGNADCDHWWPWKGRTNCGWRAGMVNQEKARNQLFDMGAKDVPVDQRRFGEGFYLRPNLVQFCHSKNILIEGVTMKNAPMFEINPVLCTNVTVRGIKIVSHGPNNDGCDPDSCTDVLIENCSFDTGDDCIAIKAGRNRDGRRVAVPTQNVVIRGCEMKDGHGGLTIGSEMSGNVRNVFVENCKLSSPNLNQALRFKTNAMRGGTIEHIFFRDITIGEVSDAVLQIDFTYEEGEAGPERPVVRDIDIRNVTCHKSKYALQLRGFASSPIRDIRIENCAFNNIAQPNVLDHVDGLKLSKVKINGKTAAG